jgi:hypothetical protein
MFPRGKRLRGENGSPLNIAQQTTFLGRNAHSILVPEPDPEFLHYQENALQMERELVY